MLFNSIQFDCIVTYMIYTEPLGKGGEGGRGEEYRQMNYRYRCIQLMVRILIIQLSSLYESKGRVYACVMSDRERLSSIIDTC